MVVGRVRVVDKHIGVFLAVGARRIHAALHAPGAAIVEIILQRVLVLHEREQVGVGHHRVVGGVVECHALLRHPAHSEVVALECAVQVLHEAALGGRDAVALSILEVALVAEIVPTRLCHHELQFTPHVVAVVLEKHLLHLSSTVISAHSDGVAVGIVNFSFPVRTILSVFTKLFVHITGTVLIGFVFVLFRFNHHG